MASLQKLQTILYEVQQACGQLSLPKPTGVFDSLDETALAMGAVANLGGILLTDEYNWQHLQETFTCAGDGTKTSFPLPTDFGSIVDNTGWSNAVRRPIVVLNAQQWAAISSWLSQSFFINPACRIYQNTMQFMSPPAAGSNVTFQYKVSDWVIDADDANTTKAIVEKNGDTPRFDWLMMTLAIKVKWLELKGMDTTAAQNDLETRYGQLTQKDEVAPTLYLNGGAGGGFRYLDNEFNVPDTGLGS